MLSNDIDKELISLNIRWMLVQLHNLSLQFSYSVSVSL